MAIRIPFSAANFSTQFKPKISGLNVSLDYYNIESALMKVASDMKKLIGVEVYNALVDIYSNAQATNATNEIYLSALDYMQRMMLHRAIYDHLIFLIVRIGNDGITVKKSTEETTIYKYQQDELSNVLINLTWFWGDQLIRHLQENSSSITEWDNSDTKTELNSLPVNSNDFYKWVGIDNYYFVARCIWIQREIWNDMVLPRKLENDMIAKLHNEISRAVCYESLNLSCLRLSYSDLPENIRKDINNEFNKKSSDMTDTYIRTQVSQQFAQKASRYWNDLDIAIVEAKLDANPNTNKTQLIFPSTIMTEEDKSYYPGG